jgi:hypothetical protein
MSNIIVMAWLLSLGFTPNSLTETNGGVINASNCLVQNFGVDFYLADSIHIYSTVEIQETKTWSIYFDPFRCDFLIGGSFYFKNISLGVLHECNHDIVTSTNFHAYNGWEAGFNSAYINYVIPIIIDPKLTITPSITLADQFTEAVRIKNNDKKKYFEYNRIYSSPNILSSEFRLEMKYLYLRSRMAFQAGYAFSTRAWAYTQFNLGAELFYKNVSLGLEYVKRTNKQTNAGYSMEGLTLFIRFRGIINLL